MNKQKVIGLILGVVLFIALIAGLTYAYISWNSDNINLTVGTECFNINYDKGKDINGNSISSLDEDDFITTDENGNSYVTIISGMEIATIGIGLDNACSNVIGIGSVDLKVTTLSDAFKEDVGNSVGALKYKVVKYSSSKYSDVSVSGLIGEQFEVLDAGVIDNTGTINLIDKLALVNGFYHEYMVIFYLDGELVQNDAVGATFYGNISAKAVQGAYKEIYDYDYTGDVQVVNITQAGIYKLEVWGAQGGSSSSYDLGYGGYGGYSSGYITLNESTTIYIAVGGKGIDGDNTSTTKAGGYNGGGDKVTPDSAYYGSSGGGATHMALNDGLLSTLSESVDAVLIVAGGGGGGAGISGNYGVGGSGGGYAGNSGTNSRNNAGWGAGGTQLAGGCKTNLIDSGYCGSFGLGNSTSSGHGGAGGGGFYGGGSTNGDYIGGGGGGSGYINNSLLTNKAMYCYECAESSEDSIKTISTAQVKEKATSNCAKIGNGFARITYISTN